MSLTKKMICLIAFFAVLMSMTACDMPMKIVGNISDPKDTVTAFFDSVCDGNFAESDRYLSGVSLSMKKQVEGVFAGKLYDYLIKSYRYQINGDVTSESLDANCKVDFTFLNPNLLSGDLKAESTKLGKKYVKEIKEGYVQEKNGTRLRSCWIKVGQDIYYVNKRSCRVSGWIQYHRISGICR